MILTAHLLFGAAIASKIQNPFLAAVFAFLGHYLLDLIPHVEYDIKSILNKRWKKSLPAILKVAVDFFSGILIIFIFSDNQPIIYICAFLSILPDGFTVLSLILADPDNEPADDYRISRNKILNAHNRFHRTKIHFLKNLNISKFWKISNQALIIIISASLIFQ